MNPLPFILLAISLPLLLGGCGEKEEPVAEVKPVGEKQVEIEEEVKNEKPTTESKPNTDGVKMDDLEFRDRIAYFEDSPYTGKGFEMYINGQKQAEMNFKNGKKEGSEITWHLNGQKFSEVNYKDGEKISEKFWNKKGCLLYTSDAADE